MIFLEKQKIIIDNFQKIISINESKIEVIIDNKVYVLEGSNFHIIYFEKKELIIEGDLNCLRRFSI